MALQVPNLQSAAEARIRAVSELTQQLRLKIEDC
jgi:hypothetical protein